MMCEICGVREASIKFTQIINKTKQEMHICKSCAEEKGLANPMAGFPKIIGGLILGIMGELPETVKHEHIDLTCNYCQLSWNEFQKSGLLGCAHCYENFSEPLRKMLLKMHGSNKHIGNRPADQRESGSVEDVNKLRSELSRAIKAENFERAAKLRDKIRDIEAGLDK